MYFEFSSLKNLFFDVCVAYLPLDESGFFGSKPVDFTLSLLHRPLVADQKIGRLVWFPFQTIFN